MGSQRGRGLRCVREVQKLFFLINYVEKRQLNRQGGMDKTLCYHSFKKNYQGKPQWPFTHYTNICRSISPQPPPLPPHLEVSHTASLPSTNLHLPSQISFLATITPRPLAVKIPTARAIIGEQSQRISPNPTVCPFLHFLEKNVSLFDFNYKLSAGQSHINYYKSPPLSRA